MLIDIYFHVSYSYSRSVGFSLDPGCGKYEVLMMAVWSTSGSPAELFIFDDRPCFFTLVNSGGQKVNTRMFDEPCVRAC